MSLKILVVDDEKLSRLSLAEQLKDASYDAEAHESPFTALSILESQAVDLLITDLRMPVMDGHQFLREIKQRSPETEVIMMSAHGSVPAAVQAMRDGAVDFLIKPFSFDELEVRLRKLVDTLKVRRELAALRRTLNTSNQNSSGFIGVSQSMKPVFKQIEQFAPKPLTVLITGETGSGKEVVARALHLQSPRASGPFVALGCGAIPKELAESELFGHEVGAFTGAARRRKGRVELAEHGTLFLDDIDDLPLDIQVKLLRLLQEFKYERVGGEQTIKCDIRIIAATKVDLGQLVAQGKFREDLYYRLNVLSIPLPPLRDRREDILLIARSFINQLATDQNIPAKGLAAEAAQALQQYNWPGNVRELRHAIEYAMAVSVNPEITVDDLPSTLRGRKTQIQARLFSIDLQKCGEVDFRTTTDQFERELIMWAMQKAGGNQAVAAQLLKIPRTTLINKLRQLESGS